MPQGFHMKFQYLAIAALAVSVLLSGCSGNGNDHGSGVPTLFGSVRSNGQFFVSGEKGVVITSTDGTDWSLRPTGTEKTLFSMLDQSVLYAFGSSGTALGTPDGGLSWTSINGHDPSAIYGSATADGVIVTVGANGKIETLGTLTLQSPGTQPVWTNWPSGTNEDLHGVCQNAQSSYIAVGDNGTILGAALGDITWTPQVSGTTENLNAIVQSNNFVAVGDNGTIVVSTGEEYSPVTSPTTANLHSVCAGRPLIGLTQAPIQPNLLVAVGDGGTILTSDDSGLTWAVQTSHTTEDLMTVTGTSDAGFVAAGKHGTVLTSLDGVNWIQRLPIQEPH